MTSYTCDATVLFCDIRNFTTLLENQKPIEAVRFANEVLAVLGNEIEINGGTVDRFTGDGFMAHFGINGKADNHAESACNAAIDLRKRLTEINSERYRNDQLVVNSGIGLHTGEVAVGNITTGKITQLTILGDTVNTASRIEGLTKFFSVDVLVSESTQMRISDLFKFQKMPLKKLKGKEKIVQTYWLLPTNSK
ncbi:adenylate/guanylate cyclase domain-containing protein [Rhodohalobacter sp. SW132]|uniref:adenylate/guanylate cyclase domain-containing protein n=1 Tax=Rhodohalobacter sp. SW132 TaxID=2293433 RepID=UPI000E278C67|nr:adenylate/guanylate cyclase domain-containing protein [Rhodohalobacter sp. SW132]REL38450.1 adenylate/guanylate cyclase domain-containing protein [Rhodohalobacter sp. SW132]